MISYIAWDSPDPHRRIARLNLTEDEAQTQLSNLVVLGYTFHAVFHPGVLAAKDETLVWIASLPLAVLWSEQTFPFRDRSGDTYVAVELPDGPAASALGSVLYAGPSLADAIVARQRRRDLYRDEAKAEATVRTYRLADA